MFSIYRIVSPSGRCYIGLTNQPLQTRWNQHQRKAQKNAGKHPFYDAIRKYGADSFTASIIDSAETLDEAKAKEIFWISKAVRPYNVSKGGDYDSVAGIAQAWSSINATPDTRKEYITKLSESKKANDWSDYADMSARGALWRKEHPREAYANAHRAARIARRGKPTQAPDSRTLKERLLWKYKRGDLMTPIARARAKQGWANKSCETLQAQREAAKATAQAQWAGVTDPDERSKRTEAARGGIDREKQGRAASKGLKAFWAELKKDPLRYEEYMRGRTATLMKRIEEKKCGLTTS